MLIKYGSASRYKISSTGQEADRKIPNTAVRYTTYMAKDGETVDILAYRLLGDFSRYWEIADLNPHIKFPNALSAGQVIRIPQ